MKKKICMFLCVLTLIVAVAGISKVKEATTADLMNYPTVAASGPLDPPPM